MESTIREERVEGESPRLLRRFDCHHLNHPTPVGTNPATQLVDRVELGNVTKDAHSNRASSGQLGRLSGSKNK